jgi:hypothetical protein
VLPSGQAIEKDEKHTPAGKKTIEKSPVAIESRQIMSSAIWSKFITKVSDCYPVPITISCACDGALAARLHHFLSLSRLSSIATISFERDEITIQGTSAPIAARDIRRLLEGFLGANNDLREYSVTSFGELFTVGMRREIDELFIRCNVCGYLAYDEDQLSMHNKLHALLFIPL